MRVLSVASAGSLLDIKVGRWLFHWSRHWRSWRSWRISRLTTRWCGVQLVAIQLGPLHISGSTPRWVNYTATYEEDSYGIKYWLKGPHGKIEYGLGPPTELLGKSPWLGVLRIHPSVAEGEANETDPEAAREALAGYPKLEAELKAEESRVIDTPDGGRITELHRKPGLGDVGDRGL